MYLFRLIDKREGLLQVLKSVRLEIANFNPTHEKDCRNLINEAFQMNENLDTTTVMSLGKYIMSFGGRLQYLDTPIYKLSPVIAAVMYGMLINEELEQQFSLANMTSQRSCELMSILYDRKLTTDDVAVRIYASIFRRDKVQITAATLITNDVYFLNLADVKKDLSTVLRNYLDKRARSLPEEAPIAPVVPRALITANNTSASNNTGNSDDLVALGSPGIPKSSSSYSAPTPSGSSSSPISLCKRRAPNGSGNNNAPTALSNHDTPVASDSHSDHSHGSCSALKNSSKPSAFIPLNKSSTPVALNKHSTLNSSGICNTTDVSDKHGTPTISDSHGSLTVSDNNNAPSASSSRDTPNASINYNPLIATSCLRTFTSSSKHGTARIMNSDRHSIPRPSGSSSTSIVLGKRRTSTNSGNPDAPNASDKHGAPIVLVRRGKSIASGYHNSSTVLRRRNARTAIRRPYVPIPLVNHAISVAEDNISAPIASSSCSTLTSSNRDADINLVRRGAPIASDDHSIPKHSDKRHQNKNK